jgi:hypothetical protein
MRDSSTQSKKLEWKWVGIVFSLFLVFYLLPISIAGKVFAHLPEYVVGSAYESPHHGPRAFFIGSWSIVGVIIITAGSAFIARRSIFWESGISAVLLAIVWLIVYYSSAVPQRLMILWSDSASYLALSLTVTAVVFYLSLVGAWLGERLRKALKTERPPI